MYVCRLNSNQDIVKRRQLDLRREELENNL